MSFAAFDTGLFMEPRMYAERVERQFNAQSSHMYKRAV